MDLTPKKLVLLLVLGLVVSCGKKDEDDDDTSSEDPPKTTPPLVSPGTPSPSATFRTSITPFSLVEISTTPKFVVEVASSTDLEVVVKSGSLQVKKNTPPYQWSWSELGANTLGVHEIVTEVRDNLGNKLFREESEIFVVPGSIRVVLDKYPTIKSAVEASGNGDVVVVTPGTYMEQVVIEDKTIALIGEFFLKGRDPSLIEQTILDGGEADLGANADPDDATSTRGTGNVLEIHNAPDTIIMGLTVQRGQSGISTSTSSHISHCLVRYNADGVSYESGSGTLSHCRMHENADDGIDVDFYSSPTITNNLVFDNEDDGLEMRFHDYASYPLTTIISGNEFRDNGEDGIQFIDHQSGASRRQVYVGHNIIAGNVDAGIGMMGNMNSLEDFSAYPILETLIIHNNVVYDNHMGITGGARTLLANNIIANNADLGLKGQQMFSLVRNNIFHTNGSDHNLADLHPSNVEYDPILNSETLFPGANIPESMAIDFIEFEGYNYELKLKHIGPVNPAQLPTVTKSETERDITLRAAIIGDFGIQSEELANNAALIASLKTEFIITTGDNNYPAGEAETLDDNVGQYFANYIFPYSGDWSSSATENRFYPTLGNHDWETAAGAAYFDYFTLPGNERYYDFVEGDFHFFALSTDPDEPDGNTAASVQAAWLQARLAASTAKYRIVFGHHSPFSSGKHGSRATHDWPFRDWGATAYFSGHDHVYERFDKAGFPYVVIGLSTNSIYQFKTKEPDSVFRYRAKSGFLSLEYDGINARVRMRTHDGKEQDQFLLPSHSQLN